jgi:hypothetical protein
MYYTITINKKWNITLSVRYLFFAKPTVSRLEVIKQTMIELSNCDNYSKVTWNDEFVKQVKDATAVPCFLLLIAALILTGIVLVALVMSKCFQIPNSLLYFNISLVDAIMAVAGIIALSAPLTASFLTNSMKLLFLVLR